MRVLVVDDDAAFLAFAREGLGPGVDVECAATPLEAIWILERHAIDVVVCDLVLGHSDGSHVLQEVRERWPSVARVLVTGFGDRLSGRDVLPSAQAVILKPCDLAALRGLLGALPSPAARRP